jgi:DNA polymerase-4
MKTNERTILHIDCDAFYASVECLHNPALRGRPMAVVGDPELRHGIVLAKSQEAKRFGVQTGDALWQARQKCKEITFVPAHFEEYLRFSHMTKEIFSEYSDRCESFGLDESWIDLTGCTGLFGDGPAVATQIRRRMKEELGITASVGVSFNKVFAKLGSDMNKPDGMTVIPYDGFREKVWPLPVKDLLYVGRATTNKLKSYGITTIGALAQTSVTFLKQRFGKIGRMLWMFANGLDTSPVSNIGAKSLIKSIGNSTTAPRDLVTDQDMKITLYALCESVSARLREHSFRCKTVALTIRDNSLYSFERQLTLKRPSCITQELFEAAFSLQTALQERPAGTQLGGAGGKPGAAGLCAALPVPRCGKVAGTGAAGGGDRLHPAAVRPLCSAARGDAHRSRPRNQSQGGPHHPSHRISQ